MIHRRLSFALLMLAICTLAQAGNKIGIVNEGGIRDAWMLAPGAKLPAPAYPEAYAANQAEACVAIGYLLNADGTTSDFAMLNAWSAAEPKRDRDAYWTAFAQDASNALALWKFLPRPEVASPKPVYTVATFLFASANPAELRKRCAIPNLGMRLVELRHDSRLARRMASQDVFARLDIDPMMETRYREQERQRNDALRSRDKIPPPQTPSPPPPQPSPPPGG